MEYARMKKKILEWRAAQAINVVVWALLTLTPKGHRREIAKWAQGFSSSVAESSK